LNYLAKTDLVVYSGISILQTDSAYARTTLELNQADADQDFIFFNGHYDNTDPPSTGNLTTVNTGYPVVALWDPASSNYGWNLQGFIKIKVGDFAVSDTENIFFAFYSYFFKEE